MNWRSSFLGGAAVLALTAAACSEPPPGARAGAEDGAPAVKKLDVATAPLEVPPVEAAPSSSPEAQAIDAAAFAPPAGDAGAKRRMLVKVQVLLDRARFSPGVIDGQSGENLRQALAAFQHARGLTVNGQIDERTWVALTQADGGPVMQDYVITEEDVAGPFTPSIPTDYAQMAKLPRLGFRNAAEAIAETFHMDERLLTALNPTADFAAAGTRIIVARPRSGALAAKVARIEVDKAEREVRAYGADRSLLAVYPATVGSTDRPAPTGSWAVRTIAPNPTWTYDPTRLTFGKPKGKLTIAAGPNNPVGVMWIDLTKDTYGLHGTPDPAKVGKAESHGCVRLTNWDVAELGAGVVKGAEVVFVGAEGPPGRAS